MKPNLVLQLTIQGPLLQLNTLGKELQEGQKIKRSLRTADSEKEGLKKNIEVCKTYLSIFTFSFTRWKDKKRLVLN